MVLCNMLGINTYVIKVGPEGKMKVHKDLCVPSQEVSLLLMLTFTI